MQIQVIKNGKKKKETSSVLAILKTVGFFAVLFAAGYLFSNAIFSRMPNNLKAEKADNYETINFRQLSDYEYYTPLPNEPVNQEKLQKNEIPESIKALNGKKVAIKGFMLPADVDDDGKSAQFALNGNYDMCFYGAPTQINDWVIVTMPANKKAFFSHNPLTVYGTIEVGEKMDGGELVSLYRIEADSVGNNPSGFQ